MQKQKTGDPDKKTPGIGEPTKDERLDSAVEKGKEMLAALDKQLAEKKKRGHYEYCCGTRRWVSDD